MRKIILLMLLLSSFTTYSDDNIRVKKDYGNLKEIKIKEIDTSKIKNSEKNVNKVEKKIKKNLNFEVITKYKNLEEDNLKFDISLEKFNRTFDNYIFVRKNVNIRKFPDVKSKKITTAKMYQKLELLEAVENKKKEIWYKIITDGGKVGYIYAKLVSKRSYDYEKAINNIKKLNKFIEENIEKIEIVKDEKEEKIPSIIQVSPEEIIINGVKQKITEKNIDEIKRLIEEQVKRELEEEKITNQKKANKRKSLKVGIKVLKKYKPLDNSRDVAVDSKGNGSNQTVTVYTDASQKKHYNLPDGSLLKVVGETRDYFIIKSPFYEEKLYYPKKLRYYIRSTDIDKKIDKFICISKRDQNEITFELDDNNNYIVKLISNVTTGKKSKYGFETPNGYFLVSVVRPFMKYVSHDDDKKNDKKNIDENIKEKKKENDVEIVGQAKIAIRFTGGAYLHGLPYKFEPKETVEERKKSVAGLLGTYPRSLKCIRNYDEVVQYQSDWIKYKSQDKFGNKKPAEPVVVIVVK